MEFHPQDRDRFQRCKVDMTQQGLIEAYQKLRQIYSWLGQIGPIPMPLFMDLAKEFGPWESPKDSQGSAPEPAPIHRLNGKPKPVQAR